MTPSQFSDLQKVFKFTADDLTAYREGRLSDGYIARNRGAQSWLGAFWLSLIAIIMTAMSSEIPVIKLLVVLGLLAALWKILHEWSKFRSDIRDGRVVVTTGTIGKEIKSDAEGDPVYKIYIRHQPFTVNEKQYEVLRDDVPYSVYFMPRSNTILAVELIARPGQEI